MMLIFDALHTHLDLAIKDKLQNLFSVKRKLALNLHVTFLFLFSICSQESPCN